MPISDDPVKKPKGPTGSILDLELSEPIQEPVEESRLETDADDSAAPIVRGSRWVDYDTHELLTMISELEDERRWARLREGIWIAILFHIVVLSALTWIPKYVLHEPAVIDPFEAIKQRKDLTYLDAEDALRKLKPKVVVKPLLDKPPVVDKKTLEALNKATPPPPAPAPAPPTPPAPVQPTLPTPPAPQPQIEAPRPTAVPARPNFAMNSQNPADLLHDAMKGAAHNAGQGNANQGAGGLAMHPGAGSGVEILSDTQGVDFNSYIRRAVHETQHTWDPLIPDEVNAPINKTGTVMIRFKILPNGRVMEGSMILEGRSGDSALDRAAWGAITGSNYPALPREFHGPYLELRFLFLYNTDLPK